MIAARPDLLVIGGLTVDRFADGSSVPGGSVLHIARAAAPRGIRVAVITVVGPEPEAQAGLAELRQLASTVEDEAAVETATFNHRVEDGGRRLSLEHRGGRVHRADSPLLSRSRALLLAPIAGEIESDKLAQLEATPVRGAILQGWLRSLDEGAEVRPLPLRAVASRVLDALAGFDLLVASREDLLGEADDPRGQLIALRRVFATTPLLVVTDGVDGLWLDAHSPESHRSSVRHLPVPWRVETASTLGAGDVLAAFLTTGTVDRAQSIERRTEDAMRVVAEVLEERRS